MKLIISFPKCGSPPSYQLLIAVHLRSHTDTNCECCFLPPTPRKLPSLADISLQHLSFPWPRTLWHLWLCPLGEERPLFFWLLWIPGGVGVANSSGSLCALYCLSLGMWNDFDVASLSEECPGLFMALSRPFLGKWATSSGSFWGLLHLCWGHLLRSCPANSSPGLPISSNLLLIQSIILQRRHNLLLISCNCKQKD